MGIRREEVVNIFRKLAGDCERYKCEADGYVVNYNPRTGIAKFKFGNGKRLEKEISKGSVFELVKNEYWKSC